MWTVSLCCMLPAFGEPVLRLLFVRMLHDETLQRSTATRYKTVLVIHCGNHFIGLKHIICTTNKWNRHGGRKRIAVILFRPHSFCCFASWCRRCLTGWPSDLIRRGKLTLLSELFIIFSVIGFCAHFKRKYLTDGLSGIMFLLFSFF